MITVERARPAKPFRHWPGPIEPPAAPEPSPTLTDMRRQGWTFWFGRHTGQYWAAHTRSMRLVYSDTPEELLDLLRALTRTR